MAKFSAELYTPNYYVEYEEFENWEEFSNWFAGWCWEFEHNDEYAEEWDKEFNYWDLSHKLEKMGANYDDFEPMDMEVITDTVSLKIEML